MSKKHQFKEDKDEHGDHLDPFYEMLEILDTENLLRFRRRLEKVGRKRMVEILSAEIKEREAEEKVARAALEKVRKIKK